MFGFNVIIGVFSFIVLTLIIIAAMQPAGKDNYFSRFLLQFTKPLRGGLGARVFYWLIGPALFMFVTTYGGIAWIFASFIAWQKIKPAPTSNNATGFGQ